MNTKTYERRFRAEARKMEQLELQLEESKLAFRKLSRQIAEMTHHELWHTDSQGGRYFWRNGGRASIEYPSASEAINALVEETIEWLD